MQSIPVIGPTARPGCRYMGAVWTLVVTGMDGIVFWGPTLIHTFIDSDSGVGALLQPVKCNCTNVVVYQCPILPWRVFSVSLRYTAVLAAPRPWPPTVCMQAKDLKFVLLQKSPMHPACAAGGYSGSTSALNYTDMEAQHCRVSMYLDSKP